MLVFYKIYRVSAKNIPPQKSMFFVLNFIQTCYFLSKCHQSICIKILSRLVVLLSSVFNYYEIYDTK